MSSTLNVNNTSPQPAVLLVIDDALHKAGSTASMVKSGATSLGQAWEILWIQSGVQAMEVAKQIAQTGELAEGTKLQTVFMGESAKEVILETAKKVAALFLDFHLPEKEVGIAMYNGGQIAAAVRNEEEKLGFKNRLPIYLNSSVSVDDPTDFAQYKEHFTGVVHPLRVGPLKQVLQTLLGNSAASSSAVLSS